MAAVLHRRAATMAAVLHRRAATALTATIRSPRLRTTPRLLAAAANTPIPPFRRFAALAHFRLPAAATTTTTTAVARASATVKTALRRNHLAAATPEALEARIQRVVVDLDAKLVTVRLELQKGTADAFDKLRLELLQGSDEACQRLNKLALDAVHDIRGSNLHSYETYVEGQARINDRISNLAEKVDAEGRRSLTRAAKSTEENARLLMQVGKVSWRIVVTVVTGAASTAFAVCQLMKASTTDGQTAVAEKVVTKRTSELHQDFRTNIESTVKNAVEVAMAHEARRRSDDTDDVLRAFNARMDEVLGTLDERVARAVEVALAKQAKGPKKP